MPAQDWQTLAARKRAARDALIPPSALIPASSLPPAETLNVLSVPATCRVLSARELEITDTPTLGELQAKIKSRELKAVDVVGAFAKRALVAHQLTNCLTEIFIESALERAKEQDEHYDKTGELVGPLHGIPVSLKEQINVQGVEMSFAYVGWLGRAPAERNSVLVDILIDAGAVPYVRTNVSQGLWFGEANNNVFGRTSNPANRALTCGGSSGGEGALGALGGAILGVGSDIGGSVRIPAAFNGLYGLRPSYGRVPYCLSVNSAEGQSAVPSVLGPLARSIDGLKTFMQVVAHGKPWTRDPLSPRMPWSQDMYDLAEHGGKGARLCFAVMWDDGITKPTPPYVRALKETKKALLAAGHEVIDWEPFRSLEGSKLMMDIFNADGGADLAESLALSGEPNVGLLLNSHASPLSALEFWRLTHAKNEFVKASLDHWVATKARTSTGRPVDAVIAPVSCSPPPPHNTPVSIYYTSWGNLNDFATAVVPVTRVDPALDAKAPPHDFHGDADKLVYDLYEPELFRDAPIAIQVVGQKLEEEAVIAMAEIVDKALKTARN